MQNSNEQAIQEIEPSESKQQTSINSCFLKIKGKDPTSISLVIKRDRVF
jgi:hypothetical protein